MLTTGLLTLTSCGDNKSATTENGNASDSAVSGSAGSGDTASAGAGNQSGMGNSSAAGGGGMAMGDPNGPTGPHKDDKEFMMTAAHSDQNEIQQSKMALAKGVTGWPRKWSTR